MTKKGESKQKRVSLSNYDLTKMLSGYEIFLEVAWILHRIHVTASQDYLQGSSSAHLLAWRVSLCLRLCSLFGEVAAVFIFIAVFIAVVVTVVVVVVVVVSGGVFVIILM